MSGRSWVTQRMVVIDLIPFIHGAVSANHDSLVSNQGIRSAKYPPPSLTCLALRAAKERDQVRLLGISGAGIGWSQSGSKW